MALLFHFSGSRLSKEGKDGDVLTPDSDGNIWFDAVKANIGEQKLLQNVVKEFLNFVSRDIGWLSLELLIYHGQNLFTK